MPPVSKPTLNTTSLAWADLTHIVEGDLAFFSLGNMSEAQWTAFADSFLMATLLRKVAGTEYFEPLGELAEKPVEIESSAEKLPTRNYLCSGQRKSSVKVNLNGISELQKNYFENQLADQEITIVLAERAIMLGDPDYGNEADWLDKEYDILVFNGMHFSADWQAESDGLFSVTLTSEMRGITDNRIFPLHCPPHDPGKAGGVEGLPDPGADE